MVSDATTLIFWWPQVLSGASLKLTLQFVNPRKLPFINYTPVVLVGSPMRLKGTCSHSVRLEIGAGHASRFVLSLESTVEGDSWWLGSVDCGGLRCIRRMLPPFLRTPMPGSASNTRPRALAADPYLYPSPAERRDHTQSSPTFPRRRTTTTTSTLLPRSPSGRAPLGSRLPGSFPPARGLYAIPRDLRFGRDMNCVQTPNSQQISPSLYKEL